MWPDRRLIDLLDIEHPIGLAPMAGFCTTRLAAEVCASGALGSIGCGVMSPEAAATTIRELRGLTDRPISVNFFCHAPANATDSGKQAWRNRLLPYYRELDIAADLAVNAAGLSPFNADMCAVVEATRPEVVSFHFGLPVQSLLARVKAAGCRVMSSATTVEEARWLEEHGADVIIAQGYEAGGHRATFLAADVTAAVASQSGTMALLPQIVDAVSVPVVAAGGIADGRAILAACALGAAGVQIGTAYLLCPEAGTPPLHRDALRKAEADASVLTNVFTGRPARALINRFIREVGPMSDDAPPFPAAMDGSAPLRGAAERCGSTEFSSFWAGQAAPLLREMPAAELTARLVKEAAEQFARLSGR
jgi:nitronate monooxygenase